MGSLGKKKGKGIFCNQIIISKIKIVILKIKKYLKSAITMDRINSLDGV